MNDLPPTLLRQLREIADEWDARPDPEPDPFVMPRWSGGASPAGGYFVAAGLLDAA